MAGARQKPSTSGRFQGFYTDEHGKKKYFTGSKKRKDTVRMAQGLEENARKVREGYRKPKPTPMKHRDRPYGDVVSEHIEWGKLQGRRDGKPWSEYHTSRKKRYLDSWGETLELKTLADLDNLLPRVRATLQELSSRGKAPKTLANVAEAITSFCRWCVINQYLCENPLEKLGKIDGTPQSVYRAMTTDEIRQLLEVVPEYLQILYVTAMTTGLRAGELRSLTRDHLDLENNGLSLKAGWTKNRKAAFQPLPARLVERLDAFSASGIVPGLYHQYFRKFTCPADALLYVPSHPARTLDEDLKRAGIPKKTPKGKLSFHALRTCYVTLVYEAGATVKEAQSLARHSKPELTANIYGRTRDERLAEVTERGADRVLLDGFGANMVQQDEAVVTDSEHKLFPNLPLTQQPQEWRRGESNPRPVMFQGKRLHV